MPDTTTSVESIIAMVLDVEPSMLDDSSGRATLDGWDRSNLFNTVGSGWRHSGRPPVADRWCVALLGRPTSNGWNRSRQVAMAPPLATERRRPPVIAGGSWPTFAVLGTFGVGWTAFVVLLASAGGLSSPELPFVSAADRSWHALARLLAHRPQGFAYPVALRVWMMGGTSELWLRMLSALFAAAAVGFACTLAGTGNRSVVGRTLLPMGAAVGMIRPASRIEPTTLAFALVLGSIVAVRRVRNHSAGSRLLWAAAAVGAAGTSIVLVPVLVVEFLWLRGSPRRGSAKVGAAATTGSGGGPGLSASALVFGAVGTLSLLTARPTDWRPVTALVERQTRGGDAILFAAGRSRLGFEYYRMHGSQGPARLPTPVHPLAPWGGFGIEDVAGSPSAQTFERARDSYPRLWIVAPSRRYVESVEVAYGYPPPALAVRFGAAFVFRYDFSPA